MLNFLRNIFCRKEEVSTEMKYLIVGLGNMHPDYNETRHNIGFEVIDMLAQDFNGKFKNESLGDLALIKHRGRQIYLLKPSTYMNRSGKSVRYWMQKLKIKAENLMVVVDDINLEYGKLRMRSKGADGGHNGLKDIQNMLATSKYPRLRFGIGNDFSKGRQVDYVLGKWSSEELDKLGSYIQKANEAILSFVSIGISHTMNKYNN
ncbi:MAG: aminoacyl-tRNA hydrolase [Saprospiraceae bacterium]|nr:aminoacyl-tRNA hydrolase [Bacteroidia bacterium]MBT8229225.1 aminoacyl-tRNA hydrolase [Bacteroidia bacterium]NNF21587.1 aminoacyl-tRNA hydrolase [Saprospiraceae bacterium]NNK89707.1 aminoacyl-tRNA hydrolase [Saprospiraceae bacterium]